MSSFAPDNTLGNFIPENFSFDNLDDKDSISILKRALETHARTINRKDTGQYEQVEILCNQQFFGDTPQDKKFVYRKCFKIGAVGTGASLNIAHGIDTISKVTRLYGNCITNVPDDRPIPFSDVTNVTNQISILRNGVNIVVTNGATAPAIVSGVIVAEYIKN